LLPFENLPISFTPNLGLLDLDTQKHTPTLELDIRSALQIILL